MIVFLGNAGKMPKDAPAPCMAVFAIALLFAMALSWTFVWFILMPFGLTHFGVADWAVKGLIFYFVLYGPFMIYSVYDNNKKLEKIKKTN